MARFAFLLLLLVHAIRAHGRLDEPPSRDTAWRHGFPTPVNYDDHGVNCGGFSTQWGANRGACGVCGDAFHLPSPRPHEHGGRYGTGLIVRTYRAGDIIPVTVHLTASHRGFWLVKLCTDARENDQDCFDKITLKRTNGETRFHPDSSRVYRLKYKLPEGVACENCVVQWTYTAGNNWGYCANGTADLGCGPQENFRACADVRIQTTSYNNSL